MGNPILPRAPLILVLAEVNFSPILSMQKKVAEIQECLRNTGFPEFDSGQEESDPDYPQSEPALTWRFGTKNHRTAIVISNDTLTLETSEYSGFDNFTTTLRQALSCLSKTANPNLIKSINFRYINLIQELDGKKADQLIRPKFMELAPMSKAQSNYQYESAQFETTEGIIRINLIKTCDDMTVPPDREPAVLIPEEKVKDGERIILDINHITFFNEVDFSDTKVLDASQTIHSRNVRPAFESIATPLAFEIWGKE